MKFNLLTGSENHFESGQLFFSFAKTPPAHHVFLTMEQKKKVPAILPIVLFLELVALGATFPVIAYYVRELGGTGFHVTLCFFLTAAPKVLLQPLWGGLSDRIGRKPVLVLGFAGAVASYAGWAIAPGLLWFLAARAFMGLFGTQLTLAMSIVADRLPPGDRAKGVGILGATAGFGFILGPILGGTLASASSYATVGWANAGLELLALVLTAVFLRETLPKRAAPSARKREMLLIWKKGLSHPDLGPLLLSVLSGTIGLSVLQGTLILLAEDRWGYDVRQSAIALAVFFLIGALVQGGALRRLVPRFGELTLARAGAIFSTVGLLILLPDGPVVNLWAALSLIGIGMALNTPTLTALLSRHTGEHDQGTVQGLNQGFTGLGRALSGVSMGWLYDWSGAPAPFGISAVLVFVSFLMLIPLGRSVRNAPFRTGHTKG